MAAATNIGERGGEIWSRGKGPLLDDPLCVVEALFDPENVLVRYEKEGDRILCFRDSERAPSGRVFHPYRSAEIEKELIA